MKSNEIKHHVKRVPHYTRLHRSSYIELICLEGVKVLVLKGFSSPQILYTFFFVNEGNFSITHTLMSIILKVCIKWHLFEEFPFNKPPVSWVIIAKYKLKLLVVPKYCLQHALHEERYTSLFITLIQLIRLHVIFSLSTGRSK